MRIGPYQLDNNLLVAPMAGVTDRPFRTLCRKLGAGMAVTEMIASNSALWGSPKSMHRLDFSGEPGPIAVQILGADPKTMADAAPLNVERGAQIIDINMGCPAKKVCKVAAGSALLKDPAQVAKILDAVIKAVEIPVTLKIRTGWSPENRNGVAIAKIAEAAAAGKIDVLIGTHRMLSGDVRFADLGLLGSRPELIVSGINHGANLGDDVIYSGTVAAALLMVCQKLKGSSLFI